MDHGTLTLTILNDCHIHVYFMDIVVSVKTWLKFCEFGGS